MSDEQSFQQKLAEIHREISVLPAKERAKLAGAPSNVESAARLGEAASSLQESVDALRLSVKYLVFDLEATKRENAALRLLLEVATDEDGE